MVVGFFGIAGGDTEVGTEGGGGERFSTVDDRKSGFFDVDPAKLFRRLAGFDFCSGSDNCRICLNSSGGGGGNGSS